MSQLDKEEEFKRAIEVKHKVSREWVNIVRIEDEESSFSSSMSLYIIESDRKYSEVSSRRSPTLVEVQVPDRPKEVHNSPNTDKNQSESHSQVQQEEEDPSSYNIDEIFEAFTFNLYKKEVSRKRIGNEKQNDGTLKEVQEDQILFAKTDEDPIIVAIALAALSQATAHNVTMLSEKLSQAELDRSKLQSEMISLRAEVNKRRKVECETTPLQATILEQQEKVFDVKMDFFNQVKKMTDKVKSI